MMDITLVLVFVGVFALIVFGILVNAWSGWHERKLKHELDLFTKRIEQEHPAKQASGVQPLDAYEQGYHQSMEMQQEYRRDEQK